MKASFWRKSLTVLAVSVAFIHTAATAQAAQSGWESADYAQVRLLAGDSAAGDVHRPAGLEVRLAPGWHAYWRMPGDGGLPPEMDWSGSTNVDDVTVSWPVPRRYIDAGLHSFGYEGQFILPLQVKAADAGADMMLDLALNLMVCEEICVPQNFKLTLAIPADGISGSMHSARLSGVELPFRGDTDNLSIANAIVGPDAIVATINAARGFGQLDVFVEAGDMYITSPPEIAISPDDPQSAQVRIAAPGNVDNLFNALSGKGLTLTVTDGVEAIERTFDF